MSSSRTRSIEQARTRAIAFYDTVWARTQGDTPESWKASAYLKLKSCAQDVIAQTNEYLSSAAKGFTQKELDETGAVLSTKVEKLETALRNLNLETTAAQAATDGRL